MVAGVQPGASCQGAGVDGTVAVDELEAVEVGVVEVDVGADVVVEQGQLVAKLAQGRTPVVAKPSTVKWVSAGHHMGVEAKVKQRHRLRPHRALATSDRRSPWHVSASGDAVGHGDA
jgi:hypothetical protein